MKKIGKRLIKFLFPSPLQLFHRCLSHSLSLFLPLESWNTGALTPSERSSKGTRERPQRVDEDSKHQMEGMLMGVESFFMN